jgi:hypothetical protein
VGSEADCQIRMPDALHQTVAGGGDAVGAMLCLGVGDDAIQISDHRLTDAADSVKGQTSANAAIARTLRTPTRREGVVSVTSTNGLHTARGAMRLRSTHPGLTLTGTATGKAGDGVDHWDGLRTGQL